MKKILYLTIAVLAFTAIIIFLQPITYNICLWMIFGTLPINNFSDLMQFGSGILGIFSTLLGYYLFIYMIVHLTGEKQIAALLLIITLIILYILMFTIGEPYVNGKAFFISKIIADVISFLILVRLTFSQKA